MGLAPLCYSPTMVISTIALTIASLSLLWNMASTIYTWNIAKPRLEINVWWLSAPVQVKTGSKHSQWLSVTLSNPGRSATSVTSISAICESDAQESIIAAAIDSGHQDYGDARSGLPLPHTLEAQHSGTWYFDIFTYPFLLATEQGSLRKGVLIEVGLGTGRIIRKEIDFDDRFKLPLAFVASRYESESMPNGEQNGEQIEPTP